MKKTKRLFPILFGAVAATALMTGASESQPLKVECQDPAGDADYPLMLPCSNDREAKPQGGAYSTGEP